MLGRHSAESGEAQHSERPSLDLDAKLRAEERIVPPPTYGARAKGPVRQTDRWAGGEAQRRQPTPGTRHADTIGSGSVVGESTSLQGVAEQS